MTHVHRLPLWFRVGALMALVITFVVALLAFLDYANFRKTVNGLIETRYTTLGKDSRQSVEAGMSLGITIAQNAGLAPVFRELKSHWPAIRFAGVVGPEGKLQVGAGTLSALDTLSWQKQIGERAADAVWFGRSGHDTAVGLNLEDNFGGKAGAVVIAYDDRELEDASAAMLGRLLLRAMVVLIGAAALSWLGAWWFTRQLAAELDEAEAVLGGSQTASTLPPTDEQSLVGEARLFVLAIQSAEQRLSEP
jgi:hypothetical protein